MKSYEQSFTTTFTLLVGDSIDDSTIEYINNKLKKAFWTIDKISVMVNTK